MCTRIYLILAIISVSCTAADGSPLGWGTWLGADWRQGEENMRSALSIDIKNIQTTCKDDVNKQCNNDSSPVTAQSSAYTQWTKYKRHMYKRWDDVPYGFGHVGSDQCLRFHRHISSKCTEWINKAEAKFGQLQTREKGNDKREIFVIFSTIFATAVSAAVGYLFGLFLKERDDVFAWNNRRENKKIIAYFCLAISLPGLVILWASPKLLLLMAGSFGIGRAVQLYRQKRVDEGYLGLFSDSGLEDRTPKLAAAAPQYQSKIKFFYVQP